MIEARSYQIEAVQSIYNYFASNTGNPVIAMPTGTGKSVVIAMFLKSVYEQYANQKILVLTHVKELIDQNHKKLKSLWKYAPSGVYSAGLGKKDSNAMITFAGIGSVAKKAALFGKVDLIIIDEAHLVSPNESSMYQRFLGDLKTKNPYLKVIGLTATPWRLGQGKIIDPVQKRDGELEPSIFTDFCFDITGIEAFNRLIAEGFISTLIPKSTRTKLDVDGVHIRNGDFIAGELQNAVDKTEITIKAVKEAIELGENRKSWLVFTAGVDHCIHTAEILNDFGIPAIAIHSKLSNTERDEGLLKFKSGYYRAAVNNNILTTGFDHPEIDLILCLRPTMSTVLWVQMLGRGTRPAPGKENTLVLDFAANTKRLGPINDPVVPRKKGSGTGEAPVKECPVCLTINHASVKNCVGFLRDGSKCPHEFVFETKLKQIASSEQLIKGDVPKVEVFAIDHITYSRHEKIDRPAMIKVSYYCGLRMFNEFVCPEHDGYALKKAREWWQARIDMRLPDNAEEALDMVGELKVPTHLRVWVNKKYPEILATCFDGSAFGTQEISDAYEIPTTEKIVYNKKQTVTNISENISENNDEIPF